MGSSVQDAAVLVDMSGNRGVIESIHNQLDDRLMYSMAIGFSHHTAGESSRTGSGSGMVRKGPPQQLFFAPTEVVRRTEQWGPEGYQHRAKDALENFVQSSQKWMEITHVGGGQAVERTWRQVFNGAVAPNYGMICSMFDTNE